ncbi:MAG: hypothetical protein ALECFALPRED_010011 [Alectoria fallacina]|uniref:Uncharacterized protein n=1 Tax=Alectoria fallacina TaxID=1903189 RepID=A0A8H3PJX2_9LECA|nr:MAG: hypothetical protein ALECFALPRED_010011 [Alectoria fallacina]
MNESLSVSSLGRSRIIVTLILDAGVEIDTTSAKGHMALRISAAFGNQDLVDRLLTRSVSVNFKSLSGFAALHDASLAGRIIVIKQLLYAGVDDAGVDVNAQSSQTWNVFDWVALDPSALSYLLASPHVRYYPTSPASRKSQVRQNICTLARSMLQSRVATDIRVCFLSPCLLTMHDATDAEHAYQLDVRDHAAAEGQSPYIVKCDLCDTGVTGNLYICITCAGRPLYEDCMTQYKEKTKKIRGCKDHAYHAILSHRH